jgi:hypothetical protein
MFGGILLIFATAAISFMVIEKLRAKYTFIDVGLLRKLFIYHILISVAYYIYGVTSGSDSEYYYVKVINNFRGPSWQDFYGTSTIFIEFVGYPFIQYFSFSYEAIMVLFSFFGFLGFVYFYIFFKENIRFQHTFLGVNLLTLTIFLPNLHFWSSSFGKGSLIFLGLGLFFFGIGKIQRRFLAVIIGGIIIYHVRPHIMLIVLISSAIAFVFSSRGLSLSWRLLFLAGSCVAFFFIYQDVLSLIGIDEEEFLSQGLDLTHRASELTKAASGIDISSYNLPFQIFTFLYRPLFVDAPGMLGLIVSFENVFYLVMTLTMFARMNGIKFIFRGTALTKAAFLSFLTVSIALAQISGNLGLAMRQKSQVMILFMFVIISFLDSEKYKEWKMKERKKLRLARQRAVPVPKPGTTP